jgi:hypothetical protein
MDEKDNYSYRIVWSEEDEEYIGLCDEIPFLSWQAPEPEEALQGILQLVTKFVTEHQIETGDRKKFGLRDEDGLPFFEENPAEFFPPMDEEEPLFFEEVLIDSEPLMKQEESPAFEEGFAYLPRLPFSGWIVEDVSFEQEVEEKAGLASPPPQPDPEPGLTSEDWWRNVEPALVALRQAGLFAEYDDLEALAKLIGERCVAYDNMRVASPDMWCSFWHNEYAFPTESRHPWVDAIMLIAFGTGAGYALHNAIEEQLTGESLRRFGQACRQLSGNHLQLEHVDFVHLAENQYRLEVNQRSIAYDGLHQPLWTVPLDFLRLLNEHLPEGDERFEAFTLLPIYGETLAFYLTRQQKDLLQRVCGWQFFDWALLERGAA